MARKNRRKGHPQHGRGKHHPAGYHKKARSPGIGSAVRFLEKHREEPEAPKEEAA